MRRDRKLKQKHDDCHLQKKLKEFAGTTYVRKPNNVIQTESKLISNPEGNTEF